MAVLPENGAHALFLRDIALQWHTKHGANTKGYCSEIQVASLILLCPRWWCRTGRPQVTTCFSPQACTFRYTSCFQEQEPLMLTLTLGVGELAKEQISLGTGGYRGKVCGVTKENGFS
jgi:hypothetical protein